MRRQGSLRGSRRGSGLHGWKLPVRLPVLAAPLLVLVLLGSELLTAFVPGAQVAQAHANKAKLDQELTHARTALAIPDRLLTPIASQEQQVANGDDGARFDSSAAATQYDLLYTQLLGVEKTALPALEQQAQEDMQAFGAILNERRGEGFAAVAAYQQRFDDAQQAFTNAKTPADYAHVSDLATAQTQALVALWPAYEKLRNLQALITSLHGAGASTQLAQQLYDQDLQVFRDAASSERYQALGGVIDAQIVQMQADQAAAQPYITKALLAGFQARINLLRQYIAGFQTRSDLLGQYGATPPAATFQKQHDDDATLLGAAHQFADYATLATTITTQDNALVSPLIRAKALYDYQELDTLVHSVANRTIINKQPNPRFHAGAAYPLAYEYLGEDGLLDNDIGIGPASKPTSYARADAQFQAADFRITSLEANLRALLDNYDPATDEVNALDDAARINSAHERPHPADAQLMQYYHVMDGKVIIVSLREQVARFYENGALVGFTYVTTGDPDVPSVPGFWTAINRHSPANPNTCGAHPNTCPRDASKNPIGIPAGFGDVFTPPKPGEYNPTPIHYDIAYHEGGFWLHDAYWRHKLGPETNLPHYDPNAFSSGSHGCINIPYQTTIGWNMEQVYNWTPLGTPIILY
jgi:hypothetical protein